MILLIRECVTSYTVCMLIPDEQKVTLRDHLIQMCAALIPLDGPLAVIRTDAVPGFVALTKDELLAKHRISIEIGNRKNQNKNPVAERAVQELEDEILRREPNCRSITPLFLAIVTAGLNTRIRSRGLSSREMMMQRDQFTCEQLPINDRDLILKQNESRKANHPYSEQSKASNNFLEKSPNLHVGDLVYLYSDRNKTSGRNRYMISSVEGSWYNIRKFSGSQLRQLSYRVRQSDCYRIPAPPVNFNLPLYKSDDEGDIDANNQVEPNTSATVTPANPPDPPMIPPIISTPPPYLPSVASSPTRTDDHINDDSISSPPDNVSNTRHSQRMRKKPAYLNDYVLD